jgi:hypothetical protein
MVRMPNRKDQNSYDADYAAVKDLRDLGGKHGVAIVLVHHLRKAEAPAAIQTLVEIACKGKNENARITAAVALLDRAYGRPAQSVEMDLKLTKNLEQMTLQELQELRERYAALALASPSLVIEHDNAEQPEDVADNEQGDA